MCLWWWVGWLEWGGVVFTVIFMSNPTTLLRLCCVVVGVVTIVYSFTKEAKFGNFWVFFQTNFFRLLFFYKGLCSAKWILYDMNSLTLIKFIAVTLLVKIVNFPHTWPLT